MTWTKWIVATVVYVISFLLYIVACFYYGSAEMHIDVGGLVVLVVPAYIILFWSLDEARKGTNEQIKTLQRVTSEQVNALKESTQRQIESFSAQIQGVISALERVIGAIGQMSEDIRKKTEQEERRIELLQKQNEEHIRTLEREEQRNFEAKQRIAPRVFVRLADESWWFFFRHYRFYVFNSGGSLKDMSLTYSFTALGLESAKQTVSIAQLGRNQGTGGFDCGDVAAFSLYTAIQISVYLRDKDERLYVGTATIDKSNRDWANIPLSEKTGE